MTRFPLAEFFRRLLRRLRGKQEPAEPPPDDTLPGRQGNVVDGIWHPPIG